MQIRSSKSSCMEKENRLYSISLGVASLQGGSVGVATALSPATCRPFQVFSPSFFVGLGLVLVAIASLAATLRHQLWMRRADKGDGFAFVSPVDAEIFVIYRGDAVAGVKLTHADEAKIG